MFSGGDFHEVGRWLLNFLTSHAKRESPRVEALVDETHPTAYGARLRLGGRLGPRIELDAKAVADNRGDLEWCQALAEQVRGLARDLLAVAPPADAPNGRPDGRTGRA